MAEKAIKYVDEKAGYRPGRLAHESGTVAQAGSRGIYDGNFARDPADQLGHEEQGKELADAVALLHVPIRRGFAVKGREQRLGVAFGELGPVGHERGHDGDMRHRVLGGGGCRGLLLEDRQKQDEKEDGGEVVDLHVFIMACRSVGGRLGAETGVENDDVGASLELSDALGKGGHGGVLAEVELPHLDVLGAISV